MQVTQPNEFYKGLPKEDVFFVKDDQNNPVGEGFLIYQYQPTIFPSRPVNIYFSMTSKPEGEYWLLGSLAARARQLRNQAPGSTARASRFRSTPCRSRWIWCRGCAAPGSATLTTASCFSR